MTMMGLDIEAIEHLDFDYAPPCEQMEDCGNEAAWVITPDCCFKGMYFCTPCKDALVKGLERDPRIYDSRCKVKGSHIISIDPIGT